MGIYHFLSRLATLFKEEEQTAFSQVESIPVVRRKRGRVQQYTVQERKERQRQAAARYYEKECERLGRKRRSKGETKLNLGVSPVRDGRSAYNRAYYLHTKATGNKKQDRQ